MAGSKQPTVSSAAALRPTVASTWQAASGAAFVDDLLVWPPDLFAFTEVILGRTQAYRFLLSPTGWTKWPPSRWPNWAREVESAGQEWAVWAEHQQGTLPEILTEAWRVLREHIDMLLADLAEDQDWHICEALFTLHAIADEACAGLGVPLATTDARACAYRGRGRELLTRTGSLARIQPEFLRVLPKVRTAPGGSSLNSFSRYACVHGPGTEARWFKIPTRHRGTEPRAEHANLLLLPWPLRIRETDFRPMPLEGSPQRLTKTPFGYFEYAPQEPLDLSLVARTVAAAREEVGSIDLVVFPESAVPEAQIEELEDVLDRQGVTGLIAGTRQTSPRSGRLPGNWVHTGLSPRIEKGPPDPVSPSQRWFHIRQNKHHPWSLDEEQIYQYHLGGALHPRIRWGEAIDVPRRSLQFYEFGEDITLIALVCEDLAQIDDVAEMIRAVGPTGVVTPLLDGPQLGSRWAARYASVLADDPGSAVLTLTSFGMVQRSRPHGHEPSRVIALWKDPARGQREIALEPGAQGVVVTACAERATRGCADGRSPIENAVNLYDVAVYQVRVPADASAAASKPPEPRPQAPAPSALEAHEVSVVTAWAQSMAEALTQAPERAAAVVADARAGAPWRAMLGLAEPSSRLVEAIESLGGVLRGATPPGGVPTFESVLTALEEHLREPGLDGLVRRVVQSTLERARSRCEA
jgi:hypothetical protein